MKKTTNRLLAILLAAVLLCGILPLSTAAEGTDITAAFTDPAFRAAVQELIGKDVILDTDVAGVRILDVSHWEDGIGNIKSLAGLEYFIALESLYCYSNQITVLPALPSSLKELHCGDNQITSLPVLPSGLEQLWCHLNQLFELPALPVSVTDIYAADNRLTSLPALPANLKVLSCDNNLISILPTLPSGLEWLGCSNNQLTELPALPSSLVGLVCFMNQLSELPELPLGLLQLLCMKNQLTSLDVTGLHLNDLDCRDNNIASKSDVIGFTGEWDNVNFFFNPQNPPPPTHFWDNWPPFLQWLLEYVFFGWVWMRWL